MKEELRQALNRAAAQGLYLFPVRRGTKDKPCIKWKEGSSNDKAKWKEWIKEFDEPNFGVDCGKSGLFVLDVDTKNGHRGDLSALALLEENELASEIPADWCAIRTPSGGMQYWMAGTSANSAGKLGDGLDVRSVGGYVLLPGSETEKGIYELVNDKPFIPAPKWLIDLAGAPQIRGSEADTELCEWDDPANVADAVEWLLTSAPVPVEGERDHACYAIGCKLRDYAVAEETAVRIAAKHWLPKWGGHDFGADELTRSFSSSYRYAMNPAGIASAKVQEAKAIADMPDLPEEIEAPEEKPLTFGFIQGSEALEPIEPTRWLIGHRVAREYINIILAPGGVGKSTLTIADALSVACGKPLLGARIWTPGNVWLYSLEDDANEIKRRLFAAAKIHGVSDKAVLDRVFISCAPNHQEFVLARKIKGDVVVMEKTVQAAMRFIRENDIVLFVGDPFVRSHRVEESSNSELDVVAAQWDRIAKATGCAVLLVHHTRKKGEHDVAGDVDMGRGASAFTNAARSVVTFYRMTKEEAQQFGINVAEGEHLDYLRLDNAKANIAPPARKAKWFRMRDVGLDNATAIYDEDRRATLEPVDLEGEGGGKIEDLLLWETVERCIGTGHTPFADIVESAMADPAWPCGMETKEVNKLLTKVIDNNPLAAGLALRIEGKRDTKIVTATEEV